MNYTFDPIQFKEFGYSYAYSKGYAYRYQSGGRFLIKSLYIPQGPNSEDTNSFSQFLDELDKKKFTKIIIDLPLILDKNISTEVEKKLLERKYSKREYIQDEETILIQKSNFACEKKVRWYIRKAQEASNTIVKSNLTVQDIQDVYRVYLEAAARIHYEPKSLSTFQKLAENCLVALSYNKEDNQLEGFAYGYITTLPVGNETKTILQTIFAGTTNKGMQLNCGYSTYYTLIDTCLNEKNIDYFDFHGASRTKNRDYTTFKTKFGGEFVKLAGSFEKLILF
jgi:hypothetical protein